MNQFLAGELRSLLGSAVSITDKPQVIASVMPSDFAFDDDEIGVSVSSLALVPGAKS